MIDTPFRFQDGDFLPVYVEHIGNHVRFFDGGETLLHFDGRGIKFTKSSSAKFLKNIATENGASVNSEWEIESWATGEFAAQAFEKYLSTMIHIVHWEHKQIGVSTDLSLFLDEVSMCFKSAFPNEVQTKSEEYVGISGHKYRFDFIHGNRAVLAVNTHHASVAGALKKLIDLKQISENLSLSTLVVIDDRYDKQAADNESKVLTAVSSVLPMSVLESKAKLPMSIN